MTDEGNTGINGYKDGFGDAFKAISWIKGFSALVWGAASVSSPTISCSHEDKHDELHQNSSKQLHEGLPGTFGSHQVHARHCQACRRRHALNVTVRPPESDVENIQKDFSAAIGKVKQEAFSPSERK